MKWHIDYTNDRAFTGLICIMSVTFFFQPPAFCLARICPRPAGTREGGWEQDEMNVCVHVVGGGVGVVVGRSEGGR